MDITAVKNEPTAGEILAEIEPLIGVVAVAGPPVVVLAVPWLFMGLMLAAPFAVLVAVVLVMAAAAALAALALALLASPFLLVRHLQRRRPGVAPVRLPATQLRAVRPSRVLA
jgi:hypothetical protein